MKVLPLRAIRRKTIFKIYKDLVKYLISLRLIINIVYKTIKKGVLEGEFPLVGGGNSPSDISIKK